MEKPTCIEGDCDKPSSARNLCQAHYFRRRRSGTLPEVWEPTRPVAHILSSVDIESRTADCSLCGPRIRIRIRVRKGQPRGECADYKTRSPRSPRTPEQRRRDLLWGRYGMTVAEYQIRYEAQNGKCLICKRSFETLVVDHCHATGRVRGLLCSRCNLALGMFADDRAAIQRAAVYLKRRAA